MKEEVLYGRHPVHELLRSGRRPVHRIWLAQGVDRSPLIREILARAEAARIKVEAQPRARLDAERPGHQGLLAFAGPYPYADLEQILLRAAERDEPPLLLLLDVLQDPQNLGTLLRSAEAVGVHGVLIPPRRGAGITPAVVSASAGASEHMLVAQTNLAQAMARLKEAGIWFAGLEDTSEARPFDQVDLSGSLGLVVGSEGDGLRRLVRDSCDFLLRLPMRGQIDSLNAAVAGSIALYAAWQARSYAGARSTREQDSP